MCIHFRGLIVKHSDTQFSVCTLWKWRFHKRMVGKEKDRVKRNEHSSLLLQEDIVCPLFYFPFLDPDIEQCSPLGNWYYLKKFPSELCIRFIDLHYQLVKWFVLFAFDAIVLHLYSETALHTPSRLPLACRIKLGFFRIFTKF